MLSIINGIAYGFIIDKQDFAQLDDITEIADNIIFTNEQNIYGTDVIAFYEIQENESNNIEYFNLSMSIDDKVKAKFLKLLPDYKEKIENPKLILYQWVF